MEYPSEHFKMVEELKQRNIIKSSSVAKAMKEVDRSDFTEMLPYTDWYAAVSLTSARAPLDFRRTSPPRTWMPSAWYSALNPLILIGIAEGPPPEQEKH